ncbi:CDP-alcohol phosphatidyltransferase family protein, partial [Bremerella sp. JC817]|uniref:CDP-alcohol phosphatidyltransferase family protein n=1 Tax=Bremerella sp. JC817 TaxID=3231756 RepID=UPI00345A5674
MTPRYPHPRAKEIHLPGAYKCWFCSRISSTFTTTARSSAACRWPMRVNVPNTLTAIRFVLSIVGFVLLPLHLVWGALAIFIIAVSTDWIDGY